MVAKRLARALGYRYRASVEYRHIVVKSKNVNAEERNQIVHVAPVLHVPSMFGDNAPSKFVNAWWCSTRGGMGKGNYARVSCSVSRVALIFIANSRQVFAVSVAFPSHTRFTGHQRLKLSIFCANIPREGVSSLSPPCSGASPSINPWSSLPLWLLLWPKVAI